MWIDRGLQPRDRTRVEKEAVAYFKAHPQVEKVFTKRQIARIPLATTSPDKWTVGERVRASFDAERSGDLYVVLKQYVSPIVEPGVGYVATHGSVWDYDRRAADPVLAEGHAAQRPAGPYLDRQHPSHASPPRLALRFPANSMEDAWMGLRELLARSARAFICLDFSASFTCHSEFRRAGWVDSGERARTPGELAMGKYGLAIALAASVAVSGCVQSRQYADVQFTPPQGDYRLLVMRPDVTVNSLMTGGMAEPRADWTEQARGNIINALRTEQAGPWRQGARAWRAGTSFRTSAPRKSPISSGFTFAVGNSIALHKYSGAALPTKRGKGLEYTLGEDAVSLGRRSGYDYALFLYAQDNIASTGRVALQVLGVAGCFIGFCAPSGGSNQFAYASLVDLRTGRGRLVQRALRPEASFRA